jgi:hypothetical protein
MPYANYAAYRRIIRRPISVFGPARTNEGIGYRDGYGRVKRT